MASFVATHHGMQPSRNPTDATVCLKSSFIACTEEMGVHLTLSEIPTTIETDDKYVGGQYTD